MFVLKHYIKEQITRHWRREKTLAQDSLPSAHNRLSLVSKVRKKPPWTRRRIFVVRNVNNAEKWSNYIPKSFILPLLSLQDICNNTAHSITQFVFVITRVESKTNWFRRVARYESRWWRCRVASSTPEPGDKESAPCIDWLTRLQCLQHQPVGGTRILHTAAPPSSTTAEVLPVF